MTIKLRKHTTEASVALAEHRSPALARTAGAAAPAYSKDTKIRGSRTHLNLGNLKAPLDRNGALAKLSHLVAAQPTRAPLRSYHSWQISEELQEQQPRDQAGSGARSASAVRALTQSNTLQPQLCQKRIAANSNANASLRAEAPAVQANTSSALAKLEPGPGLPGSADASPHNPQPLPISSEYLVAVAAGDIQDSTDSIMLIRAGWALRDLLEDDIDIGEEGELILDWIEARYDEKTWEKIEKAVDEEYAARNFDDEDRVGH